MTTVAENPTTTTDPDPTPAATMVLELAPDQVAQHPENIRDAGRGIKELAASISEVGVLVPLIVVPVQAVPDHDFDPAVTHVAVDGSRRQAAARAAGLPLPCVVRPDLTSARDTAITMAATGLARDGLTPREEAAAVQTMLDLGVTATMIGRVTGRGRKHVATAKKAATLTDEVATAATGVDYPFTLADLATLAEWQDTPERGPGVARRGPARPDAARRRVPAARATRTRHPGRGGRRVDRRRCHRHRHRTHVLPERPAAGHRLPPLPGHPARGSP